VRVNERDEGFEFCPFCGKRMSGQMAENKMAEVARLFGKKLGEEFTVKYEDKVKTWKFDERGLLYHNAKENEWRKNYGYLDFLIRGKAVIIDE